RPPTASELAAAIQQPASQVDTTGLSEIFIASVGSGYSGSGDIPLVLPGTSTATTKLYKALGAWPLRASDKVLVGQLGTGNYVVIGVADGSYAVCEVKNSTGISVNSGSSQTVMTFDTNVIAIPSSMHSTSSNTSQIVMPRAGVYSITAHADWGKTSTGAR